MEKKLLLIKILTVINDSSSDRLKHDQTGPIFKSLISIKIGIISVSLA